MAFESRTWVDGELVTAADMNRLEEGVAAAAEDGHGHAIDDVTGLQDALESKAGGDDPRLTDDRAPTSHADTHRTDGSDPLSAADVGAAPEGHGHAIDDVDGLQGELAGKAAGDDPRLADARTPRAHAASHATGGDDPLTAADVGAAPAAVPTAAARAAGASDGSTTITVLGPLAVADLVEVVLTGTSEAVATLPDGTQPSHRAGHGFVEDTNGDWWPARVTTTSIEILGPAPAGTTVEGSLTWPTA